jgi:Core-2/I-Branching enzyme
MDISIGIVRSLLLLLVTFLQCNLSTTSIFHKSSNVCLASDISEEETYVVVENKESDRTSSPHIPRFTTRHNDSTTFNELFQVKPCPSHCLALGSDGNRNTKLRKTKTSVTDNVDDNRNGVRIFYLILIHNQRSANDALYLFRAIRDPRNTIVIHIDKKVEYLLQSQQEPKNDERDVDEVEEPSATSSTSTTPLPLLQEIQSCPCGSKVRVESVHAVEWSKWSMNLPTLWGFEVATSSEYVNEWDVFINLSGDTIPIYTPSTMARYLQTLSYNFVTSRSCESGLLPTNVYSFPKNWHKRRHYTHDDTEADPVFTYQRSNITTTINERRNKTIITHFGSQWIILQKNFVVWLNKQLLDTDSWPSQFREYLSQSEKLMSDETFIPSILMHVSMEEDGIHPMLPKVHRSSGRLLWNNGTVSDMYHVRYERMDEHYPTSYGEFPVIQRYQVPESYVEQSLLDQPKLWGPYFLGTYDLGHIRDSGALFARKVSMILDRNVLELLPVHRIDDIPNIHWPFEISITTRPDWSVEKQLWDELHATKSIEEQHLSISNGDNSSNTSSDVDDSEL